MLIGKILILIGIVLLVAGVFISFAGRYFPIGRLPGDIVMRKNNVTFYFPLATSILLSVIVSLFLWLLSKR
jgi:hypothetical protein